jgi:DNA modification methylase
VKPYYEDAACTIYHGDCRDVLPLLSSVDHVITDPPYSEHVHSKQRRGGTVGMGVISEGRELGFSAISDNDVWAVARLLAPLVGRWMLAFSDVESTGRWRDAMILAGLEYVRTGAWVKLGAAPQFTGDRPAPGYECVTICHVVGKKRWNGGGHPGVWTHAIVKPQTGIRVHTTQKPTNLMSELVSLFTDPGETILDPFMGSGTTLVAAKRLGRKAIGIELEEKYCEIAAKRLAQGALDLFGEATA